MSREQERLDKQGQPQQGTETTRIEDRCALGSNINRVLSIIKLLLVCAGRSVYWVLFVDDDDMEEEADGKRDKKKRREKKRIFSKRFVRLVSIFGILFLGLFLVGTLRILGLTPAPKLPGFLYIKVSNVKHLKEAMTKEGPRIIYCSNVRLTPAQYRVASATLKSLPPWINRFSLDCSAKLPSGKTLYQRFDVDPATTIMIAQAHGKKGVAINEHVFTNPAYFHSMVISDIAYAIKHVYSIDTFNQQFKQKQDRALLVVTDGRKFNTYNASHMAELSKIMDANRFHNIATWVINGGIYQLNFDEDDDAPKSASFSMYCLVPHEEQHMLGFYSGEPFGKAMQAFIRNCSTVVKPNRDFKPIRAVPTLANRALKQKEPTHHSDLGNPENNSTKVNDQEEIVEL